MEVSDSLFGSLPTLSLVSQGGYLTRKYIDNETKI